MIQHNTTLMLAIFNIPTTMSPLRPSETGTRHRPHSRSGVDPFPILAAMKPQRSAVCKHSPAQPVHTNEPLSTLLLFSDIPLADIISSSRTHPWQLTAQVRHMWLSLHDTHLYTVVNTPQTSLHTRPFAPLHKTSQ